MWMCPRLALRKSRSWRPSNQSSTSWGAATVSRTHSTESRSKVHEGAVIEKRAPKTMVYGPRRWSCYGGSSASCLQSLAAGLSRTSRECSRERGILITGIRDCYHPNQPSDYRCIFVLIMSWEMWRFHPWKLPGWSAPYVPMYMYICLPTRWSWYLRRLVLAST